MAQTPNRLQRYLAANGTNIVPNVAAVLASLDAVEAVSPKVAHAIAQELRDQRSHLKLIASESYSVVDRQLVQGDWFTDRYAEGFPGHRFDAGCDDVADIGSEAAELACQLFGAEHAYVQPHSGAAASLVAFLAVLAAKVETPFF